MIAKLYFILRVLLHIRHCKFRCFPDSDDTRNIVCAGTALTFLCTSVNERTDLYAFADIHDSDSLWSVDLVTTGTEHVDIHLIHIDRHMCKGLYRIGMEQYPVFLCNRTDFLQWLDGSDLVVCCHDRDENCIRTNGCLKLVQLNLTIFIHTDISHFKSVQFQPLCCVQDRMVLDRGCDNVLSLAAVCLCGCFECPVIGLASASGEINFLGLCPDHICNLFSCFCDRTLRLSCKAVNSCRITVMLRKIREHRIKNFRVYLCGSRIVQID